MIILLLLCTVSEPTALSVWFCFILVLVQMEFRWTVVDGEKTVSGCFFRKGPPRCHPCSFAST